MRRVVVGLLVVATATACSSSKSQSPTSERASTTTTAPVAPELLPLHATRGSAPGIFDSQNRQVLLRGVNVNSLGDYYQDNPDLPPVVPVTEQDWASMAAQGFNVVRLLVSWSKLQPRHGIWDRSYIDRIAETVDAAKRHGMYSVIDMHQDAWGKYIASPKNVKCAAGGEPAIGWDGAPKWATFTDNADTCTHGSRESSEAVKTAWDSFYSNRNGIQDSLTETWGVLAGRFADNPAVAGYDLLNEPNDGHDSDAALRELGAYYANTIRVIRNREEGAIENGGPGAFHHAVFFEDSVNGAFVPYDFTTDTNIVFAPHNYGESIGDIPIEGLFDYFAAAAKQYKTVMWTGEYGWFGDPQANESKVERFAKKDDALLTAGGTWWQWRQACGDPHSISTPGGTPDKVLIHYQRNGCPGDKNLGVVPEWQCVSRPFPRATPGRLTTLQTDCTDNLHITGATDAPGTLDVWFPGVTAPHLSGDATNYKAEKVDGGFRVRADVHGTYDVTIAT